MQFDYLQMYFGDPLIIPTPGGKQITVLQPSMGDLVRIGEEKFFGTLNIFVTNTTQFRLQLWDSGIDWNEISDFDLFLLLYKGIDQSVADLMFEDVKFDEFTINQRQEDGSFALVNKNNGLVIDKDVYEIIHKYFQEMFKMKPEDEKTKDAILKQWWIDKDRRELQRRAEKDKRFSIQSVISSMVNHPGFKYKLQELRDVGVCEFYDSVQRLQIYEQATAVMKGMFSGMVDSSKIKPGQYNWMKEF